MPCVYVRVQVCGGVINQPAVDQVHAALVMGWMSKMQVCAMCVLGLGDQLWTKCTPTIIMGWMGKMQVCVCVCARVHTRMRRDDVSRDGEVGELC